MPVGDTRPYGSIRKRLGAPLPLKKAVDYAIQIACGLAAATASG